jgi:hypothetical protein
MAGSRWRLTPTLWLVLKLAAIVPIALFVARVVIFVRTGDLVVTIVILMGLVLLDGLITKWAYGRRAA